MKTQVNLVDDHQIVTDGLCSILASEQDIEVLDIANSGSQAVAHLKTRLPDIVLLDYSLGAANEAEYKNGLDVAEEILVQYPSVRIMMLTMHDCSDIIVPCITAGVHGYMLKSEKNADIAAAIRQLHIHGHYFSPEVAKDLAISIRKHSEQTIILSDREQEVLSSLFKGSSTKEIAEELFISHHTVESHRKNLLHKFEAKNSVHLIYLALQSGLLSI